MPTIYIPSLLESNSATLLAAERSISLRSMIDTLLGKSDSIVSVRFAVTANSRRFTEPKLSCCPCPADRKVMLYSGRKMHANRIDLFKISAFREFCRGRQKYKKLSAVFFQQDWLASIFS